ncbi:NAD-dependent epimerase/dehydratase family protein [Parahaliea maris]|uniref:NAD-dependent epimerase/dehydratase family protein n=1 Tax=Parahaliea maris TaxID=2716870 RepID=A0A5C8ZP63_9GAMM|nr:NAD-dependent epimerase/dehydratase family protein [Parahaliea maris]TXS90306.1 NAD-dependent epimerase/dehydratase family protein [Parahaliea maris]
MKVVVTGAGGFVGRALAQRLACDASLSLTLMDTQLPVIECPDRERIQSVQGQLQDAAVREKILSGGVDVLFHLAALPGGAAEGNPELSREVNLDSTLNLFEEAAAAGSNPRIVFTSTIAVLGAPLPPVVDDNCRIQPAMVYGTHKAMVELALADMSRRGQLDAVSVRLPGIVARPPAPSGLKSAFMSNLFHALQAGEPFTSPISPQGTLWLMSVERCVDNLVHAAKLDSKTMPASRVVTLPALRCTMGELAGAVAAQCEVAESLVSYQADEGLEAHFGTHPPLQTPAAESAGFSDDDSLQNLVQRALAATRAVG